MAARAGDMIHIPAAVPHLPASLSDIDANAVIARTDPYEPQGPVPLPQREPLVTT